MTNPEIARRVDRLEHDVEQLRFARETTRGEIGAVSAAADHIYHAVQALDTRVEQGFAAVDQRLTAVQQEQVALRREQARMSDLLEQVLDRLPPA